MLAIRRRAEFEEVRVGSVYQRPICGSIVETVRVISLGDCDGIPHVRFHVCVERPDRKLTEDARLLALDTFTRYYCAAQRALAG